jgi:iron complex outermembrane receptor protein
MMNRAQFLSFRPQLLLALGLLVGASYATQAQTQPGDSAVSQARSEEVGLAEIVVTSQRFVQRPVDVPISVTPLAAEDLAKSGITTVQDLKLVTTGVTLQSTGPWLQPAIRGVVSTSTSVGAEQNVALYLDGVYQPLATASASELPDISRVEILKGPQGTLFGRNATGGAIQIFTRDPSFAPSGSISASYGNFSDTNLTAYFTGPLLGDKLAGSISGSHYSTTGWDKNLLTRDDFGRIRSDIIRAKLLAKITDSLSATLAASYSYREDFHSNAVSLYNGNGIARQLGITPLATRPNEFSGNFSPEVTNQSAAVSLKLDWSTSMGSFTSTTAYLHNKLHLSTDEDASPVDLQDVVLGEPEDTTTQEIIFSSNKIGNFRFLAGVFGYWNSVEYAEPILTVYSMGASVFTQAYSTRQTSYAGFASGTYDITSNLSIIAGARYTHEKRKIDFNYNTPTPDIQSRGFNSFTPRVSISYKVTDDSNAYFTYAKGFKSGQWDVGSGAPLIVQPEKINSYEVGYKAAGRRLSFDAAAFYYDYTNLQVQFLDPVTSTAELQNAASSRIYGVELGGTALLTDDFKVSAQAAYTNARYKSYPNASIETPILGPTGIPLGGNVSGLADLTGKQMQFAPEITASLAGTYTRKFQSGTFEWNGHLYYTSRYGIDNASRVSQPAYVQLNSNVSWTFPSNLTIGPYVRNLTNRTIISNTFFFNAGDLVSYEEPRNYGIRASYTF